MRTPIAARHPPVRRAASPSEEIAGRISSELQSGSESEWSSGFSRNPAVHVLAYDDCHFHWACYDLTKTAGLGQDTNRRQRRHCRPGSWRDQVKVAKSDVTNCVIEFLRARRHGPGMPPRAEIAGLLDLDLSADVLEFLLDPGGFVPVYALFDRLWSAVHQVLGFLEAQAGDFTDCLDDVDLVLAPVGEHDGVLPLLLDRVRAACRTAARHHHRRRRGCRYAEGLFHFLDQLGARAARQAHELVQNR